MFNIPILFLIFNRPDKTIQVLSRIRDVKPKKLYIAADGPRVDFIGDSESCINTRKIVEDNIDWECEVYTKYNNENLGCREAVNSAISWFFENEQMGIILEDDCLPSISFFHFCDLMLHKFVEDQRIMMIGGFNHLGKWNDENVSYFFSQLGAIWGWASWRRAWLLNDTSMNQWPKIREQRALYKLFQTDRQAAYREEVCELTFIGDINTWDYIWTLSRLTNNGLTVLPTKNLIQNIGFDIDATHTISNTSPLSKSNLYNIDINNIVHPNFLFPDLEYDLCVFNKFTCPPVELIASGNSNILSKNLVKKTYEKLIRVSKQRLFSFKSSIK